MLEKGSSRFGGTFFKMSFHLSMTSVQKGLLTLNVCPPGEVGGGLPRKKWGLQSLVLIKISKCPLKCVFFLAKSIAMMPSVL